MRVRPAGSGTLEVHSSVENGGYAQNVPFYASTPFTILNGFVLTVNKPGNGTGKVTSDRQGITCGSNCSYPYAAGTQVTLTALVDGGSTFLGWSGDCTGRGPHLHGHDERESDGRGELQPEHDPATSATPLRLHLHLRLHLRPAAPASAPLRRLRRRHHPLRHRSTASSRTWSG